MLAISGCSIKKFAVGQVAKSMTSGPDVFASDEDPDLVGDAIPFGLKMMESLLQVVPTHEGLLLGLCRGFTQYSYAYVQAKADAIEATDRPRAVEMRERALKLYLRARGYGFRALERRHRGITEELRTHPALAVMKLRKKELPVIYWTAAAWGSAMAIGQDRPELTADFDAVKALMQRAVTLDERYEEGAVHEAMIALEALPEMMGGSKTRAREHYQRAIALTGGRTAGPYVTLASTVSIQDQNRAEFEDLLRRALEVDPNRNPQLRLATILLQRKARTMLEHEDDYFLDADTTKAEETR